ncbi:TrkA-N domain protein [Desulfovibrio sp. X2]|uniref:potassium channel family protein n=1 Tax=Desulfovibrio sp. X2 TaxID=941449 RepID=UPI000358B6B6|nr:potassium channel protein [Desulfovibrio sp. X2]EPR44101.1 TrkA-N domain protein [Desulfovibrio sp. X2]
MKTSASLLRLKTKYGPLWQLLVGFGVLFLLFLGGISFYMFHEGWPLLDSFYMVVITLSTVGYTEVNPLTPVGRVGTACLILGGVSAFLYIAGNFTQLVAEGQLHRFMAHRRVKRMIDSLSDHFIVCGYGRIGSVVVDQITREGHPLVVIEKDPEILGKLQDQGILHLSGDATSDDVLEAAGIRRARSLITALTQEAANVYVTLTARQLNPGMMIVARADNTSNIARLERAGADRVVMPHVIGGVRMAQSVLRPSVTNLFDLAMRGVNLQMEEHAVASNSELAGKNLIDSNIRPRFNVIIVAIKKPDGDMLFNPGSDSVIEAGDTLVTVGKPENMRRLREVCLGNGA